LFNQFGSYIQNPTEENKLEIYSDGNFEYQIIIPQYINTEKINYGQIIKIKEGGKVVEKRKEKK